MGSGHRYTFFLTSFVVFCLSFQGRLCPLLCSCRFCSLWNPLLHTSQMNLFVAIRVLGDSAITSASGSVQFQKSQTRNQIEKSQRDLERGERDCREKKKDIKLSLSL